MFLAEILDIIVPLKIELQKRTAIPELLTTLDSMQEEVALLIINRRDALSQAQSIDEVRLDIDKISEALSIMALILPQGVDLFGRNYNGVHPEEETEKKRRRRKSFGHIRSEYKRVASQENRHPLFQRKRRLGNAVRIL